MDKVLLKNLKKQDKYTKFFKEWKNQEFKGEIDEQKLKDELATLSKTIGMQESLVIACFDYRNLNLAFFTGNVEKLTGYPESMFRNKGMETSFTMIHPDDRPELFRFQKIVFDAFHGLSIPERHTFEFSYTTRWVHRTTQDVIWMTSKVRPYVIDECGNFIMDLHIIVQLFTPPKSKNYDWSYTYSKADGTRIFVSKNSPVDKAVNLTSKEREIVDLILEGKESKEISKILNISINTVATHRKNILRKLGAKNVGEMVKILASYNF
ncbi:MAG: LuxR C-terminal-related transcriptional regulator [Algoriphagus sp.]|jgi:DNA-binding CsgD family transcriptional regulator|uniref:LuxR C-terminal-related transcriptional regulator n=1 Tax=Algoriphagus sp. TaxID=1872435 RepID=UPI0027177564|nr:LuxR C-terminal-related transcriptional regulator [Algoriphagus sp.]MDO8966545.1 LuxR C-terminal-related transcriptional regulator [Algoriphagus sp.]MDP2040888.1 LuxR C-terminal-related transcriptional regulator [Algoriphagus sp.]MDP3201991.1 LuxR C-terminal-related transcriptional regulator [Algoriphagus sp.]MDP3471609.1 LuxR C-terminal-related transcriptional regulator [Algoriphagus sp.]